MIPERLQRFEANRRRLFGVAYRMLGEASEAEDVVQDAYLRWERHDTAVSPEAWLTKVVTNLCLDRLTSARVRRESYVGPWLPEPVIIDGDALDPIETVEQRESLSMGMLVLLERLTPPERAVFVLREAFGHSHREIAQILEDNEPHVRQLYRRAQRHVAAARTRFTAEPGQHRKLLERFLEATLSGDVPALEGMLAEDVVAWADGGGKATATRRPLAGRQEVLRHLLALTRYSPRIRMTPEVVNGEPAVVLYLDGLLSGVTVVEFEGDRIAAIRTIANPDKLAFLKKQKI
ncbi:DNA-directed RNA polymerase sigma-70 factor [Actinoplanes lobatus]|uniref:DNA-directed RNA polymerase sigma-70 factor n=1 Tax=Actinoplanes lobatus TaxID=113568 RepID=A0A7W7MJV3_9ACTN|nr:RNA polymerase sigma-70 factor [Actinoplanes lobatus]MBB4752445.1 RNA polymerase sigma-70 factor (ECF subfamily) [Actinoplanes lobatus]GGN97759.1 DNA-directed RNA polymerase sigma-70 factor [Actinoplanes lobatus]GIE45797.1 DNA-directed RNA polymerase sigma-70 factor [Actinoplanes lobatus]